MGNRINSPAMLWAAAAVVALATAGCASRGGSGSQPEAAPAAAAPAPAARGGSRAGMDAQGNVVDSSKVEAGSGKTVKGLNGYEGEITGNPARNSKFARSEQQTGPPPNE